MGIRARGKPYEGRNPVAYVISANVSRRQTKQTTVQKRELISRVLKESPEVSDRQVGRLTQAHHSTVSAVREEMEGCGEISHVEVRTDTKGRQQPVRKPKPDPAVSKPAPTTEATSATKVAARCLIDLIGHARNADPAGVAQLLRGTFSQSLDKVLLPVFQFLDRVEYGIGR